MTGHAAPPEPLLEADPPPVGPEEAAAIAARFWGIGGDCHPLSSERDRNYRLTTPSGERFLLKFSNPAEDPAVTNLQTGALQHIAVRDPGLLVPRILPDLDGEPERLTPLPDGTQSVTRMLSWIDGVPLGSIPSTRALRVGAGQALGRIATALSDFDHQAADHDLLWDIRNAGRLGQWLPAVADPGLQAIIAGWLGRFDRDISPRVDRLRRQPVHNDLNPHNVMVNGAPPVLGVIDFGDMVRTAVAADAAIGASYFVADYGIEGACEFLAGFNAGCPLDDAELDIMPDLIAMRMVTTLVISSWRAARHPGNAAYILRNFPAQRAGLALLAEDGASMLAQALKQQCRGEAA